MPGTTVPRKGSILAAWDDDEEEEEEEELQPVLGGEW